MLAYYPRLKALALRSNTLISMVIKLPLQENAGKRAGKECLVVLSEVVQSRLLAISAKDNQSKL